MTGQSQVHRSEGNDQNLSESSINTDSALPVAVELFGSIIERLNSSQTLPENDILEIRKNIIEGTNRYLDDSQTTYVINEEFLKSFSDVVEAYASKGGETLIVDILSSVQNTNGKFKFGDAPLTLESNTIYMSSEVGWKLADSVYERLPEKSAAELEEFISNTKSKEEFLLVTQYAVERGLMGNSTFKAALERFN